MNTDFSEFASMEKAGWRNPQIVKAYVDQFSSVTNIAADLLAELAGGPGLSVLDLCCGQGYLSRRLYDTGAKVSGLDFSSVMLDLAREAAPSAVFSQGDAARLPFRDAQFDTVVCNFGLMHLPDRQAALGEVRRVLRPGGKFIMSTWVGPQKSPAFGTVFGAIKKHADFSQAPRQPDLFAIADPEQMRNMFAQAGLDFMNARTLDTAWALDKPSDLFDIYLEATVGARMLLTSQSAEIFAAIRDQITSSVADNFQDGTGYRVPVPVAVMEAEKR